MQIQQENFLNPLLVLSLSPLQKKKKIKLNSILLCQRKATNKQTIKKGFYLYFCVSDDRQSALPWCKRNEMTLFFSIRLVEANLHARINRTDFAQFDKENEWEDENPLNL